MTASNISLRRCSQSWFVFAAVRHISKMKTASRWAASSAAMVLKTTKTISDWPQEKTSHKVKNETPILASYSPIILTRTLLGLIPSNSP